MIVKTRFNSVKEVLIEKYSPENKLIARCCIIIRERPDNQGKMASLEDVWTAKDFRRQGYGEEVIREAINVAKEEKCYKLVLQCNDSLIHWYAKMGWKIHQNSMRLDNG